MKSAALATLFLYVLYCTGVCAVCAMRSSQNVEACSAMASGSAMCCASQKTTGCALECTMKQPGKQTNNKSLCWKYRQRSNEDVAETPDPPNPLVERIEVEEVGIQTVHFNEPCEPLEEILISSIRCDNTTAFSVILC